MSLTSVSCVHSNVYGLCNIHWNRYLTAVDPLLSTSSTVQTYHHLTSGGVEIQHGTKVAGNSRSIGKVPVSQGKPIPSIRTYATSSKVSHTEQSSIIFTNVLQGQETVVLVCCTIEWEPDITCTWEVRECPNSWQNYALTRFIVFHSCPWLSHGMSRKWEDRPWLHLQ